MKKTNVAFKKPYFRWLFGGMGFHNSEATMTPLMSDEFLNERILKSYREISPTFSRVFAGFHDWTEDAMEHFIEYYHKTFALNDCSLYLVPGRLPRHIYDNDALAEAFAENVAEKLKYLTAEKDCRLIRYYCVTNEMSVGNNFAVYARENSLEKFKRHHELFYSAFRRHGLENVGLVATDTAGVEFHKTIDWAIQNMDEVTDIYCTHHYTNDGYDAMSPAFYSYFRSLISGLVQKAITKHKRYILGEFGVHNEWGQTTTMVSDIPDGFSDPHKEAVTALAASAKAISAMNAGAYATAYWTFADYPDPFISDDGHSPEAKARHEVARFSGAGTSIRYNKNGLFRWSEDGDYSARPYMYSVGLLAKFFKKNTRVLNSEASDNSIVCGGVTSPDGSVSLCLINISDEEHEACIECEHDTKKPYRVYEYDSGNVPSNDFGDLQKYSDAVSPDEKGILSITIKPKSMKILTTDYIDRIPSRVTNISGTSERITWDRCTDSEHCYYRIYENGAQIGSTVAEYFDRCTKCEAEYIVHSVDKYGNEGV